MPPCSLATTKPVPRGVNLPLQTTPIKTTDLLTLSLTRKVPSRLAQTSALGGRVSSYPAKVELVDTCFIGITALLDIVYLHPHPVGLGTAWPWPHGCAIAGCGHSPRLRLLDNRSGRNRPQFAAKRPEYRHKCPNKARSELALTGSNWLPMGSAWPRTGLEWDAIGANRLPSAGPNTRPGCAARPGRSARPARRPAPSPAASLAHLRPHHWSAGREAATKPASQTGTIRLPYAKHQP